MISIFVIRCPLRAAIAYPKPQNKAKIQMNCDELQWGPGSALVLHRKGSYPFRTRRVNIDHLPQHVAPSLEANWSICMYEWMVQASGSSLVMVMVVNSGSKFVESIVYAVTPTTHAARSVEMCFKIHSKIQFRISATLHPRLKLEILSEWDILRHLHQVMYQLANHKLTIT